MIIVSIIDKNIACTTTSKEAQDNLISLYKKWDDAHIVMTKVKLFTLRYIEPMTAFLSSIKKISNELTTLNKPTSNKDLVTATFHALLREYNEFISSVTWGIILGLMIFNQLKSLLLQEEKIYSW